MKTSAKRHNIFTLQVSLLFSTFGLWKIKKVIVEKFCSLLPVENAFFLHNFVHSKNSCFMRL